MIISHEEGRGMASATPLAAVGGTHVDGRKRKTCSTWMSNTRVYMSGLPRPAACSRSAGGRFRREQVLRLALVARWASDWPSS
ncbi:unnamed protein product [Ectocarpus sp. CCAP 1310/34]|nr:unnamed protein product [Ectocarpus sp. CCAP 1310/34]